MTYGDRVQKLISDGVVLSARFQQVRNREQAAELATQMRDFEKLVRTVLNDEATQGLTDEQRAALTRLWHVARTMHASLLVVGQNSVGASLGDQLRALREGAGLTQAQLGDQIDLSDSAVRHIEAGRRSIMLNTLANWALACGRTVALEFPVAGEAMPDLLAPLLERLRILPRSATEALVPKLCDFVDGFVAGQANVKKS